jgi:tetratricopeptide (TPR) repeat protein
MYSWSAGDLEEAERRLAQSFRLEPSNPLVALRLAEIYQHTERIPEALATLDANLRDGGRHAEVAWQAAMIAHSIGRYDELATYLDRLEALEPGRPWAEHYRASGLLHTGRPAEALDALDEEERRQGVTGLLHVLILRAEAFARLDRQAEVERTVAAILGTSLRSVDYLMHAGLVQLFDRLWNAVHARLIDGPLRDRLIERLLESGLAPNRLFDVADDESLKVEGVRFFTCTLRQPLDSAWPGSGGCLAGEERWTAYYVAWGVLALDEDSAARMALEWQAKCSSTPATVAEIVVHDKEYHEQPRVVWQGLRNGEPAEPPNL